MSQGLLLALLHNETLLDELKECYVCGDGNRTLLSNRQGYQAGTLLILSHTSL